MEGIRKYFSDLAKERHRKNPLPKEHYQKMQKASLEARRKKIKYLACRYCNETVERTNDTKSVSCFDCKKKMQDQRNKKLSTSDN